MQKKFVISFEIEAKNDLALIESKAGIPAPYGSFHMGARQPSFLRPRPGNTHYRSSRLSIPSASPANAPLEAHGTSLRKKLDVSRLRRLRTQLADCRFLLRIGVFYLADPPPIVLPATIMRLAIATGAEVTLDYYQCSSFGPLSPQERLARGRLIRSVKRDLKGGGKV